MSKKRFILPFTVFAMLISFGLAACNGGNNGGGDGDGAGQESQQSSETKPSSAKQEKINITAADGKTKLIYPDTVQLTADQEGVTWESAKPEIATVSATGLVTAVSKGSASIKAIKEGFKDGSINISVDYPNITVSAADNKTSLLIGETVSLTASEQGVTWSSADATIASVANGVVTANKIGSTTIKASKDKFNDGSITINVVRPDPTAVLHWEDAAHYSADGEWTNSNRGPGETPIYSKSSASDGTCVGYFGEGDKETLTFTSSAAVKAELVVTMGHNSSFESLATIYTAKLNNVDIDLTNVAYASDTDGQGNYSFAEVSFGEFDLIAGNNVLEIGMLGNAPYLDNLQIYAKSAATIAVVPAPEMQEIAIAETTLTVEEGSTVQIVCTTEGVTYTSSNEANATVDANGLVTGVAKGNVTITVKKDGYKTAKVTVSVTEKLVEGEIRVEVETGTSENDAVTFRAPSSGSPSGQATNAFPVDAVLTIKFNATSAGPMQLKMTARAPTSAYNSGEDFPLNGVMKIEFNGTEVSLADAVVPNTTWGFNTGVIGVVSVVAGENTIAVTALSSSMPALDLFILVPVE